MRDNRNPTALSANSILLFIALSEAKTELSGVTMYAQSYTQKTSLEAHNITYNQHDVGSTVN